MVKIGDVNEWEHLGFPRSLPQRIGLPSGVEYRYDWSAEASADFDSTEGTPRLGVEIDRMDEGAYAHRALDTLFMMISC